MATFHPAAWIVIFVFFVQHVASNVIDLQEVLAPSSPLNAADQPILKAYPNNEHSLDARFGFDLDSSNYYDHLTIRETLDGPFKHSNVAGMVAFVKGERQQDHSFEILVQARSPAQSLLECLDLAHEKYSLSILTTSQCSSRAAPIHINIVIAVRPGSLQFGGDGTKVETNFLSIMMWQDLNFETYHMNLHSTYGSIGCHETFSFTAHAITVSSDLGTIVGNWSLPSSIAFSTINGTIDIDLPPKRWSSGPTTTGTLIAESVNGSIDIRMPFAYDKLSLRNSTTNIMTQFGDVNVQLVHGAETHIHSSYGDINATLLPYWAFYEFEGIQHNYIYTQCHSCVQYVDVLTPIVDSYYKIRPLYFAKSLHKVNFVGKASVRYPRDWAGVAEWDAGAGAIANVWGEDYEVVEEDEDGMRGVIQRRPLGSRMDVKVFLGVLEVEMKG